MTAADKGAVVEHLPIAPILYSASAGRYDFVYPDSPTYADRYWLEFAFIYRFEFQYTIVVGESTPAVTASGVLVGSDRDADSRTAMAALDEVITTIGEHRALPFFPGMDDLLDQAVGLRGRPADIEQRSRHIAADVCNLTD